MPPTMPPTTSPAMLRPQLTMNEQKLILCAKLSDFAYSSATPNRNISTDKDEARKKLDEILKEAGQSPIPSPVSKEGQTPHFERFASNSWLRSHVYERWRSPSEFKWWRSHCYFYHYFDQVEKKKRIIVAFRGTWMGDGNHGRKPNDNAPFWVRNGPIAWFNGFLRRFSPSNFGVSDLYYDATLIRIPYTEGTVWKWFAYWGSLVLERTRWGPVSWLFCPVRLSAADWISRPSEDRIVSSNPPDAKRANAERAHVSSSVGDIEATKSSSPAPTQERPASTTQNDNGDVHLGFWALWASPEGFAGYDSWSEYQGDKYRGKQQRILYEVKRALDNPVERDPVKDGPVKGSPVEDNETEILVVGHSLGGAVSCFAALDLVHKLKKWGLNNVTIFHATFGAPPVGDLEFQAYFNRHFNQQHYQPPMGEDKHESWSIYHKRDIVASCFAYCGTLWLFKCLSWWGDWRGVGHRIRLCSDMDLPPEPQTEEPVPNTHSANATSINGTANTVVSTDDAPNGHRGWWTKMKGWWTKMKGWLTKMIGWLSLSIAYLVIAFILACLYVLSLVGVLAALIYSPWYAVRRMAGCQRKLATAKPGWGGGRTPRDPCPDAKLMSTDFHSLHRYIYLMEQGHLSTHAALMKWDDEMGETPIEAT